MKLRFLVFCVGLSLAAVFVSGCRSSGARDGSVSGAGSTGRVGAPSAFALEPVLGVWTGSDGEQQLRVRMGANGRLLFQAAAGSEEGTWRRLDAQSFAVAVGGYEGRFVLFGPGTASLTLAGTTVELTRVEPKD